MWPIVNSDMKYIATDKVTGQTSKAKTFSSIKGAVIGYETESGKVRFNFYKNQEAAAEVMRVYGPLNRPGSMRYAELQIIGE
jgi:hypothetical protein